MTPEVSMVVATGIKWFLEALGFALIIWAFSGFPAFWRKNKDE